MARIDTKNFRLLSKNKNNVHDTVKATYTIFEMKGNKYFQIDTYGKSDRKIPEKISQSIQLDEESAKKLIDLLYETFQIE